MNGLRGAVAFLTRIPLPTSVESESQLSRSVPWFPVVGAMVGMVIGASYAGLLFVIPPFVAATLAMSIGLVLTGALHEDGLGDVVDAFWGAWDQEERRRILKDPRLGTYGVLAITVSLLLRIGVLSSLTGWQGLVLLPAAHALSRAFAVSAMTNYEPIGDGLGASYVRALAPRRARLGIFAGVVLAAAAIGLWALPGAVLAWLGSWLVGSISMRKIGGMNGDVLGAIQQVGEILVLLMGAVVLSQGWWLEWWLR